MRLGGGQPLRSCVRVCVCVRVRVWPRGDWLVRQKESSHLPVFTCAPWWWFCRRFGPAGDPRGAGIGTKEAIQMVWSCHREIIADVGPVPESWTLPPPT